jgi:outer membrane lipoprotein-sorting protein
MDREEAQDGVMTYFGEHQWMRWAVPTAACLVVAGMAFSADRAASADPGLPPKTPAQLLADMRTADVSALSGTVRQTVDLGLPQLPGLTSGTGGPGPAPGARSALTSLLSGTHTWRVWVDGASRQRLDLLAGSGETDLIRNGHDLWLWSSADRSAVHLQAGGRATVHPRPLMPTAPGQPGQRLPMNPPRTPDEAASAALAMIGKDTSVTTDGTATVAGRPAYELVLTPKDRSTLVASVHIAIDASKHVPLRVTVRSTKLANPAIDVGFSSVDFGTPDASVFAFTPPAGTKVTQGGTLKDRGTTNPMPRMRPPTGSSTGALSVPKVVGSGWSTVVVGRLPAGATTSGASPDLGSQLSAILSNLPEVHGTWGSGRVLEGTLFTVVLTDDGRVAVGAVGPQQVYAALAAS